MGYIRGFVHGVGTGTVIGLCLAPQTGDKTRQQLKAAYGTAKRTAQKAQQIAQTAAPYVQVAATTVRGQVDSFRHHDDAEDTITVNGRATSSTPTT